MFNITDSNHLLPTDLPKEIPAHTSHNEVGNEERFSNNIKTLLSWHAPGRPFRKKSKQFFATSILIALLIEIILFLFGEYLLMIVVLSLIFASFVLATVPPTNFHYRISSEGITVEDNFFLWQELYDFYFKERNGETILHVRTYSYYPGEITLVLGEIDKEHIKQVLVRCLPYREIIRQTLIEKWGDWIVKTFPLEGTSKVDS